jgi:hypothetical protein
MNLSCDVSSPRNHKTSRGRRTDRNNHRVSGGRTWHHKTWHVVRWLSFISQDKLLKFNERTYKANIYNSELSAAALCSRHCCPHLRFLLQFFQLTRHIFPSLTSVVIGPAVDQLWSPLHRKVYFLVLRGGYTGSRGLAPGPKIQKMGAVSIKIKKCAKAPS